MKLALVASLAMLALASTGSAQVQLLSNGDFSTQMTPFDPGAVAANRLLSVLTPGTWYTPSSSDINGWDCRWKVDTTNNWATGEGVNGYDKAFSQFVASPGAGTYTLSFDYQMDVAPMYGSNVTVYALNANAALSGMGFSGNAAGGGVRTQIFQLNPVPLQTTWTNYSIDFTLDDTTGALPYLGVKIEGNGVSAWLIDNFKITAPGAPALHPGDANGDGLVDVGDLGILGANYGTMSGATWPTGDFTGDGMVDVGDLGVLGANYGFGAAVPEPATMSLLALGVAGLLRRRR